MILPRVVSSIELLGVWFKCGFDMSLGTSEGQHGLSCLFLSKSEDPPPLALNLTNWLGSAFYLHILILSPFLPIGLVDRRILKKT